MKRRGCEGGQRTAGRTRVLVGPSQSEGRRKRRVRVLLAGREEGRLPRGRKRAGLEAGGEAGRERESIGGKVREKMGEEEKKRRGEEEKRKEDERG